MNIYLFIFEAIWIIKSVDKKSKRGPTKKLEGRFIITEVAPDGEPIAPEAAAKKYVRQCGCLVRTTSLSALGYGKLTIQASKGMRCLKEKRSGSGGS